MRFTLPTLIVTLMVLVPGGCDSKQRAALTDLMPGSNDRADQISVEQVVDIDAMESSESESIEPTLETVIETVAMPVENDADLNLLVADEAIPTPVVAPQASAVQPPPSGRSLAPESSEIRADNCMVQYINKVNVPAKAEGTLMELKFEEGDTVNEEDVLAVIDDTAAKLAIELKKAEYKETMINAANEVNLEDAVNSEKLAEAEAKSYGELFKEGAIPFWEKEKKRLEADRATLRIELAKMQKKIAEVQMIAKRSEVEIADFELTRRKVTAPLTGYVEARIAQLGEWVQPGSPIATVIQMDRLRVEGDIDALRYPRAVHLGTPVEVSIYSEADKAIKVNGKLGYVSMEIDLNNRYRVWVEVENKKVGQDWLIKPGMRAEIVIRSAGQLF